MKVKLKKCLKENMVLVAFTFIVLVLTLGFSLNSYKIFTYFKYRDKVKKSALENHKAMSCDFSKIKAIKTKKGNYILINSAKNDRSYNLISKNEIGCYSYKIQGKYFINHVEPFSEQRNRIIKKYEYNIFNLDKNKATKKIDIKALLNKYCEDCFWTEDDILENDVVYSVKGKTYISAGCVNPTKVGVYFSYDPSKKIPGDNIFSMHYYGYDTKEDYSCGNDSFRQLVTYGGLYISLDQKDIVKSLLYYDENMRNVFKSVGENNCRLDPKDVKYNYIFDKAKEAQYPYDNMKQYPNSKNDKKERYLEKRNLDYEKYVHNYYAEDYYKNASILDKIKKSNGIDIGFATDYTNPFCKVKIEFNSSDLKSNMTNLFNKYPELKKYVGVKGKKITLFDHDLENDDQVLQLFTPEGKPLSFAGVKDDKVGEITGVADYCQKMKAYNEAHLADDKQN
ncbi:hypothetical protein [Lachnobacterium bovis]|uniref:hypothetical protein n=1 Tax=Lachnobacterium bovis TaxID=140626 RepID=UPI0004889F20|nr:hypothetical protein [Lachnobacterium bovis]